MTDEPKPPVVITAFPSPDEKEMIAFFYTLGNCVNRWAFIDRALYRLFRLCLRLDDRQAAIFYYAQKTLNQHLQSTNRALQSLLPKEQIQNEWKPLFDKTQNLSLTRNILAHHPAKRLATSKDGKPHYVWTIHIEPSERPLNLEYKGLQGKEELGLKDLEEHIEAVESLEMELRGFLLKLHSSLVLSKSSSGTTFV